MGKHFISVLGTANYKEVIYGDDKKTTSFVQEAVLRQKVGPLSLDDRVTIFVTKEAFEKNYREHDGRRGLEKVLIENCGLKPEQIYAVEIPIGKNEEELQTIFNIMYDEIGEGDLIFADITYSFRSLPVQFLAVLCFAKVVKNIVVEGIYYGAFEARVEAENRAPIFEITSFLNIIEWAHAANSFIQYGNSEELRDLSQDYSRRVFRSGQSDEVKNEAKDLRSLSDALSKITRCIATTRGCFVDNGMDKRKTTRMNADYSIQMAYSDYKKKNELRMRNAIGRSDQRTTPFGKLIEVVDQRVKGFDQNSNLMIGLQTVKWSIDNHMTQQGYTALEESIKTYLCNQYGLDETSRFNREVICKGICNNLANKHDNSDYVTEKLIESIMEKGKNEGELNVDKKIEIARTMLSELPRELATLCADLSNRRNSLNHFGFSNIGKFTWRKLDEDLEKYYAEFCLMIGKELGTE